MRYVVTGGAGFIGSNTVDELVRRGETVIVLDDLSSGKEDNLAEVRSKISIIKGSITDLEAVRKAVQSADYVIHLAARILQRRQIRRDIAAILRLGQEHRHHRASPKMLRVLQPLHDPRRRDARANIGKVRPDVPALRGTWRGYCSSPGR